MRYLHDNRKTYFVKTTHPYRVANVLQIIGTGVGEAFYGRPGRPVTRLGTPETFY